jgi:membrane-bound metal-dependent hydrolase YbcI (DUF457 family)
MDIITHAVVGAATGAAFGQPLQGAVWAIAPDLMLGTLKRRATPTAAYNASHSFAAVAVVTGVAYAFGGFAAAMCAFFSYLSHLILDIPTHGEHWAPTLLWPSQKRFSAGEEWEWFNRSWFAGLQLSFLWGIAWLLLSLFHIGSPS